MKLQLTSALTLTAAALTVAIAPAQAFSGFTFSTDYSPKPADPKKDIKLESVKLTSTGQKIKQFSLVQAAKIRVNDVTTGAHQGPGSSDHGDGTVLDTYLPEGPKVENPTDVDVVASLGNLNLNSIIDTEDNLGNSVIDVFFGAKGAKTFYFFERGMNSDLKVEALDNDGNVVDTFNITRNLFRSNPAGYSINTTEIGGAQEVGSYGLTLDYKVAGLRLSSDAMSNGPDYKVFAAKVPEPATLAALGMVAGAAVVARRRKQAAAQ
jgi:hypothetical protein